MPIEFRILGPLELSADGRVLPLGSPKQRAARTAVGARERDGLA
jgi:DNA-binding SARP family transcriptional activator